MLYLSTRTADGVVAVSNVVVLKSIAVGSGLDAGEGTIVDDIITPAGPCDDTLELEARSDEGSETP